MRKGRISLPGHAYIMTMVTNQRRKLFGDLYPGRVVVKEMHHLHKLGAAGSLAFVVMPDHLHWLFTLGEGWTLAQLAQSLKGRSAKKLGEQGIRPVWQRGYHDHGVRDDEDLRRLARYIVANPLRAGLVKRVSDYPLWDAVWLTETGKRS